MINYNTVSIFLSIVTPLYLYGGTKSPNFLIFMTDDQSYWHTTFNGDPVVQTPNFDRIAREGVNFTHCFSNAPSCTPSRGACLTGRNIYELEEASVLQGAFPAKFKTFQELLWEEGYHCGYLGKAWGPGIWNATGRTFNPGGLPYKVNLKKSPDKGLSKEDYIRGFKNFLSDRKPGQAFSFFAGVSEPHGPYKAGIGIENGLDPKKVRVPDFIPDTPGIRSNLCDYLYEIEYADRHLGEMIEILQDMGELENTVIIVTSDNGMSFPGGKCNLYDQGSRVPFAIRFPKKISSGRVVENLIQLSDLHPTLCEMAGISPAEDISSLSLTPLLYSNESGRLDFPRETIVTAFEVHVSLYPMRAIRNDHYLYIRNYEPQRLKAPEVWSKKRSTSSELDSKKDTLGHRNYLVAFRDHPNVRPFAERSFGKRPAEEFYDLEKDPYALKNLSENPEIKSVMQKLSRQLTQTLEETGDPRHTDADIVFQEYPLYSSPEYKKNNSEKLIKLKKDQLKYHTEKKKSRGL